MLKVEELKVIEKELISKADDKAIGKQFKGRNRLEVYMELFEQGDERISEELIQQQALVTIVETAKLVRLLGYVAFVSLSAVSAILITFLPYLF